MFQMQMVAMLAECLHSASFIMYETGNLKKYGIGNCKTI